jgi:muramoyltetrapeptide carboxypeptidase
LAGPDARRREEYIEAWKDPKAKAIFVARGGYGTLRMFEGMLASQRVPRAKKIFMGLSDLTVPLNHIAAKTGLVCIHGPMMGGTSFQDLSLKDRDCLFSLLENGKEQKLVASKDFQMLQKGNAKGRLLGGNFTMLQSMLNTPLEPNFSGSILFLEEVHDPPYKIDRLFAQFALAGIFRKVKGLLLGDFLGPKGKPHSFKLIQDLVDRYIGKRTIPVLAGIQAGHKLNRVWLPIGGQVEISKTGNQLVFEALVREKV